MPLAVVTGGAGFIGSHLVSLLLVGGWQVRVLDNFSTGRQANLPADSPMLTVIRGDIRDAMTLDTACAEAEVVFHLAALVSVPLSIESPALAEEINTEGTRRVFAAAARAGVRRVIFSSSCAVYGSSASGLQHEGLPAAPASPYAATKLAGERLATGYVGSPTTVICLRYFNVYGPRQRAESGYAAVVPRFVTAALRRQPPTIYGDGAQTRDFVFVGDVARANLRAAQHRVALPTPAVFNIGTGSAVSVNDLWQRISASEPGATGPLYEAGRPGEVRFSQADVAKARDILGFTTATSIVDGLRATVDSFRVVTATP